MRLCRLCSQIHSLSSQEVKIANHPNSCTSEKKYKKGRGFHRENLARQGICLGWQGTSFPLDPLTPCTNPRLPTKIATSPNFNGHLRTKLGNSGPKGHLEWRSIWAPRFDKDTDVLPTTVQFAWLHGPLWLPWGQK